MVENIYLIYFWSTIHVHITQLTQAFKVVANKDLGHQQKWILTHQQCTTGFSTISTIPISSYRRAH